MPDQAPEPDEPISIAEMARRIDAPEWIVARGMARLISKGLLKVEDGTPEEAIASLQRQYGEAVNGK